MHTSTSNTSIFHISKPLKIFEWSTEYINGYIGVWNSIMNGGGVTHKQQQQLDQWLLDGNRHGRN